MTLGRNVVLPSNRKLSHQAETFDYSRYKGLTFKQFWELLPKKLVYTKYEEELHHILETGNKKLWVKKASGLGITEFMIRYIAWKCINSDWAERQVDVSVIIITGANYDLTKKLIGRLKGLFEGREFKTKESVAIINGCRIEAFPTNHLEPARGLNPFLVFLDEADFFPSRYQDEARTVAERYRIKGNAWVILVSTPNLPGGLFERMEEEENNGYVMKEYNYEWGLGTVFDPQIIELEKKQNPSFEREYNLKYGYGKGDIFEGLDSIINEYNLDLTDGSHRGVYGDPAFGSSNFGVLGAEVRDGIVYITETYEYPRSSPSAMLDLMYELATKYNGNCKIDSAHPGFIRDLEERGIPALPVNFGLQIREHESANIQSLRSKMTINAAQMVKNGRVRIHPNHTKLIAQLRSAQFDKKGGVDKEELKFDIGDCFLMACWDLKEFDYSHIDIRDGKIKEFEKETHKSVFTETIRYE